MECMLTLVGTSASQYRDIIMSIVLFIHILLIVLVDFTTFSTKILTYLYQLSERWGLVSTKVLSIGHSEPSSNLHLMFLNLDLDLFCISTGFFFLQDFGGNLFKFSSSGLRVCVVIGGKNSSLLLQMGGCVLFVYSLESCRCDSQQTRTTTGPWNWSS